jgi:hypothetical protein
MIHCIGDSHSAVFSGEETMQPEWPLLASNKLPYFNSYRIGPATAYQLENKKYIIDEIIKNHYNEDDRILFCFGEVDIRAHLIKQTSIQNRTTQDLVKECVDRYFEVILSYKNKGINCIVWGPIASWHQSKFYTGPSFGTCIERNKVTEEFNKYVEELCNIHNIGFVTIFYDMIDKNYETNTFYLDNWLGSHMHLSQNAMPIILKRFEEKSFI